MRYGGEPTGASTVRSISVSGAALEEHSTVTDPHGQRRALLIGVSRYQTESLHYLHSVTQDVQLLAEVLTDSSIGHFDSMRTLLDPMHAEAKDGLTRFLHSCGSNDLALIYVSGHMNVSENGDLRILTTDSDPINAPDYALSGSSILWAMNNSPASQIVLILDGCHPRSYFGSIDIASPSVTRLSSQTRVVIAAGSKTPRWNDIEGSFGSAFARGLKTGLADIDGDGTVKVLEAYEFARAQTNRVTKPTIAMYGGGAASIVIANSARKEPPRRTTLGLAGLPPSILADMSSDVTSHRERAAWMLGGLLCSDDDHLRPQTLLALYELSSDPEEHIRALTRFRLSLGKDWPQAVTSLNEPLDWSSAFPRIQRMEIHMNDMNIVAPAGDAKGIAIGRRNRSNYYEDNSVVSLQSNDDLVEALRDLAAEVGKSDLDWEAKTEILPALAWWQKNVGAETEPPDALENASILRRAGGWVWTRFSGIIRAVPDAIVAAWVIEVISKLAH
jgi:Caspase domain